jgi:2-keto-3-deoxygluconate permease
MKIMQTVKKIPGGLMIVPLMLGVIANTFFPQFFTYFDGTFTSHLWKTGAMPILAVFLFCNGATINFKEAGVTVYKGCVLTAVKVLTGMGCGLLVSALFGEAGFIGIAPIAVIAALSNSNGGIYAALAGEYGDATDVGAVSILAINDGPFFTMLALGAAGYSVPINTLLGCIIPILAGVILGNLDNESRDFCTPGASMLIPFFAFPLGAGLTLSSFVVAGIPGVLLGILSTLITGTMGYIVYRLLKMKAPCLGAAIGTTAGNAAATPAALATPGVISTQISDVATAQVSAAIIVTAILCPLMVTLLSKREKAN